MNKSLKFQALLSVFFSMHSVSREVCDKRPADTILLGPYLKFQALSFVYFVLHKHKLSMQPVSREVCHKRPVDTSLLVHA